jgi:hypothetical protein
VDADRPENTARERAARGGGRALGDRLQVIQPEGITLEDGIRFTPDGESQAAKLVVEALDTRF